MPGVHNKGGCHSDLPEVVESTLQNAAATVDELKKLLVRCQKRSSVLKKEGRASELESVEGFITRVRAALASRGQTANANTGDILHQIESLAAQAIVQNNVQKSVAMALDEATSPPKY